MDLRHRGELKTIAQPVDTEYEVASILAREPDSPMLFEKVRNFGGKVAGNVYSTRALVAEYLEIPQAEMLGTLSRAISNPEKVGDFERDPKAPCFQVTEEPVSLSTQLPALVHTRGDAGRYVTAAVFCASDPDFGLNLSFHRMLISPENPRAAPIRVVPRDLDTYLKRSKGELEVVATIGNGLGYLFAAAATVPTGYDELGIANALESQRLVQARGVDLPVPWDSEYVLEGRIYSERLQKEGPFFDLTLTLDAVREQPVFEVSAVYHQKDPLYHALLPGFGEHRVLMGLPREPTIFNEVNREVKCLDVRLTDGGGSWLHAVVKISKNGPDDGLKAIHASFRGHPSLKHVVVVDEDIDISKMEEVEWAIATRFQADKGLVVLKDVTGSSLDPSADRITRKTSKMGLDATMPSNRNREDFKRWDFEPLHRRE
jgi:2,5-furandicarboxylate decarboxylase 1